MSKKKRASTIEETNLTQEKRADEITTGNRRGEKNPFVVNSNP